MTRAARCFLPALLLFWSRPQFALKEESEERRRTSLGLATSREDKTDCFRNFTKGGDGVPGAYADLTPPGSKLQQHPVAGPGPGLPTQQPAQLTISLTMTVRTVLSMN